MKSCFKSLEWFDKLTTSGSYKMFFSPLVLSLSKDSSLENYAATNRFKKETNESGFTLIELLIATVLASIVATILFSALYQVNRFVPLIDNMTGVVERAALVNAQLERDLSGTTVPLEFYARQPKKEEQKQASETAKKEEGQKKEQEAKKNAAEKKEEEPKKPLEKVFYGVNKDGMLHQLSFITTNPLQVYWSEKSGGARARMARVLYTLKPEPTTKKGAKKSYMLVRQESANLEFDAVASQSVKELVVIDGIKSCTVEYTSILTDGAQGEEEEEKEATQKEQKQEGSSGKKRSVKKNIDWLDKKEEAQEKQKLPLIPSMVEFTLILWDAKKVRSRTYPIKIKIRAEPPQTRKDTTERMMDLIRENSKKIIGSTSVPNTQVAQNNNKRQFGGGSFRR
jgi:prepilin-type N-terminal cleavage/methylation domain-containing protein